MSKRGASKDAPPAKQAKLSEMFVRTSKHAEGNENNENTGIISSNVPSTSDDSSHNEMLTAFGSDDWIELLGESWAEALADEVKKPYFKKIVSSVAAARKSNNPPVYPPAHMTFAAFKKTPLDETRVVIIGQDPYHGAGQGMGLCFSVQKGITIPPSLRNIFKEQGQKPSHGDLSSWADQGVFMLNALLTVPEKSPMGHKAFGWETFTSAVVGVLANRKKPICFLLWGKPAQLKASAVSKIKHHCVLNAGHPSPMSMKLFFGCDHFNKANQWLEQQDMKPINWNIE